MKVMLCKKAALSPSMAVPINVTVTMPMTIPNVVNSDRILLARSASREMPHPSLNSLQNIGMLGLQPRWRRQVFVSGHQPVPDPDHATGMAGDLFLVRDDQDGVALLRQGCEQRQDLQARLGVQVA